MLTGFCWQLCSLAFIVGDPTFFESQYYVGETEWILKNTRPIMQAGAGISGISAVVNIVAYLICSQSHKDIPESKADLAAVT
ncbi:hypothetical protein LPJ71_004720, partial [Coemansia sp. S17]